MKLISSLYQIFLYESLSLPFSSDNLCNVTTGETAAFRLSTFLTVEQHARLNSVDLVYRSVCSCVLLSSTKVLYLLTVSVLQYKHRDKVEFILHSVLSAYYTVI